MSHTTAPVEITGFDWVPDFAKDFVRDLRPRRACEEIGLPYRMDLLSAVDGRRGSISTNSPGARCRSCVTATRRSSRVARSCSVWVRRTNGWPAPLGDEALGAQIDTVLRSPCDLLLSRKTYDIFAAYWPFSTSEPAIADGNGSSTASAAPALRWRPMNQTARWRPEPSPISNPRHRNWRGGSG